MIQCDEARGHPRNEQEVTHLVGREVTRMMSQVVTVSDGVKVILGMRDEITRMIRREVGVAGL